MKSKQASKLKRHGQFAGAHGSAAFTEPPPQMDVNDPRWADAFSRWAQRKAESMGMDAIEMMGRALGLNKEADGWRKRRQAELRHREEHSNDIYGKQPNDGTQRGRDAEATTPEGEPRPSLE